MRPVELPECEIFSRSFGPEHCCGILAQGAASVPFSEFMLGVTIGPSPKARESSRAFARGQRRPAVSTSMVRRLRSNAS